MRVVAAMFAFSVWGACGQASYPGQKPSYLDRVSDSVPNIAAIGRRFWLPGLEENYVPQGLTIAGAYVLVSGYKPTPDLKSSTGPCRVFRIERASGAAAGFFDLPEGMCTHAGGMAYLGRGSLLLAERIWTKEAPKARLYRLDATIFEGESGRTVDHSRSTASIPIPVEAQGAAFDKDGNLWVSASSSKFGTLFKLDRAGAILAQYDMVAGLEDLGFDGERLWGMSESGTRKYLHWETRFPFLFEIDVSKLK